MNCSSAKYSFSSLPGESRSKRLLDIAGEAIFSQRQVQLFIDAAGNAIVNIAGLLRAFILRALIRTGTEEN